MKIDEKRFGFLVADALSHAESFRNPFSVAYRGLALGDPALNRRILAWADTEANSNSTGRRDDLKRIWAETMVDTYGGVPTQAEWARDPIVAHLKPSVAESYRSDVIRQAFELVEKRNGPPYGLSIARNHHVSLPQAD